jgi:membrane protease YdiL (CAAX protease family)
VSAARQTTGAGCGGIVDVAPIRARHLAPTAGVIMEASSLPDPDRRPESVRAPGAVGRHPVLTLSVVAAGVSTTLLTALLLAGQDLMAGKLAMLVTVLATAVGLTARSGGRRAVRRLFAGLTRWRVGVGRWVVVLTAMPALTLAVAAVTGTLRPPGDGGDGWGAVAGTWLLIFVFSLTTANLWEETVWAGFVQGRLMARRGLLAGSLLTAIPFGLTHLPLAYEAEGLAGTSWGEALVAWAFLLGALPFFRYLAGTLLVDTGGSVLAVAVLHASFNASGALGVGVGGWQYVPALVVLTVLVTVARTVRGRSAVHGYAPALLPPEQPGTAGRPATAVPVTPVLGTAVPVTPVLGTAVPVTPVPVTPVPVTPVPR